MMWFINRYNLLNSNQFGFLAWQNTSDALTEFEFLNKAYDVINQNRVLLTVFLVFSKTPDTVDHEILQRKLYYYGFRVKSRDFSLSFLCKSSQFAVIKHQCFSSLYVKIGVPRGFTLRPHLFISYINELNKLLTMIKSIHFVDINPSLDHTSLINSELAQVQTWINVNKLLLNVKKTNYMVF